MKLNFKGEHFCAKIAQSTLNGCIFVATPLNLQCSVRNTKRKVWHTQEVVFSLCNLNYFFFELKI